MTIKFTMTDSERLIAHGIKNRNKIIYDKFLEVNPQHNDIMTTYVIIGQSFGVKPRTVRDIVHKMLKK